MSTLKWIALVWLLLAAAVAVTFVYDLWRYRDYDFTDDELLDEMIRHNAPFVDRDAMLDLWLASITARRGRRS